MAQPLAVTQLLLERAEIEVQITSPEDGLGQAPPISPTSPRRFRLFDPTAIDRPATVYHEATEAMRRSKLFAL